MILCVDIGNTSIKIARVGTRPAGRVQVVPVRAAARDVARAVARAAADGVQDAAIASVRPPSTTAVQRAIRRELGIEPLIVTHCVTLPLAIATRRPASVGVDRLCAASGAIGAGARHAIVVDAGTAITVDLVLDRRFRGGLIMAGPQTSLSALHAATARLPDLRLERGASDIDDTTPAMQTGARLGAAGAIEAAVRLLRSRAGRPLTVWVTGGHAPGLRPLLPAPWRYDPHLTLRGLAVIARLNRG